MQASRPVVESGPVEDLLDFAVLYFGLVAGADVVFTEMLSSGLVADSDVIFPAEAQSVGSVAGPDVIPFVEALRPVCEDGVLCGVCVEKLFKSGGEWVGSWCI